MSNTTRLDSASVPSFWDEACKHLSKQDRIMKRLIAEQKQHLHPQADAFTTLARSVIAQRISATSAQKIWNQFMQLVSSKPTPAKLLRLKIDDMRAAGIAAKKVENLVNLALHFDNGNIKPKTWQDKDDETIIEELLAIGGLGRWSAEMMLIFYMLRPNVLPLDDPSLAKGISFNYFSNEPVSRSEMKEVAKAWEPYCSVATWHIWHSLPRAA